MKKKKNCVHKNIYKVGLRGALYKIKNRPSISLYHKLIEMTWDEILSFAVIQLVLNSIQYD